MDVFQSVVYKKSDNYSGKPISISGPSAVGKSTIVRLVSQKFNVPFFDLDDEICKVVGYKTTQEVIQTLGHEQFKVIQNKCLREIVENNKGKYVLASGGEIIRPGYDKNIIQDNRQLISNYTYNICLFPSIDLDESVCVLLPRLNDGKRDVQITGDTADKFKKYIDVFDQYNNLSNLTVLTYSSKLEDVLHVIMSEIGG